MPKYKWLISQLLPENQVISHYSKGPRKTNFTEPGKGIVTISFKDYRGVNAGLSDEVFKRK